MEEEKITNTLNESKGLLLSRRIGEKILIGKSVQIEVVKFDRGAITLAIKAPKNIPVYRQEVLDEIAKQNKQAIIQDVSTFKKALTDIKINKNLKN